MCRARPSRTSDWLIQEEEPMRRYRTNIARGVLAGAACLAANLTSSAMAQSTRPNFAPTADIGWYAYNRLFIAPPSGPGPVLQDPSRPYVSNDEFRVSGRQPT